jgi:hypothetical protein
LTRLSGDRYYFTVNTLYSQPLLTVTDRYNREITPEDAHSDAFFERAPQAREICAAYASADVGARPSAPWHTHGCPSPPPTPAAPRTGRPPLWPVHLETFTQATAPPLRYHVNALARPCRRLRARGGRRQRVRECGHSEQQCGQSAVERSAVGVPSMRMKPSMEICGSGVGQRLRQLISTLADLMPRSTIIYWPSHLPCGYRTQRSEQKAVSEHFNRHRTGY